VVDCRYFLLRIGKPVPLDWQFGRDILARQAGKCWGAPMIERLGYLHATAVAVSLKITMLLIAACAHSTRAADPFDTQKYFINAYEYV
jgi:hypothetical protein